MRGLRQAIAFLTRVPIRSHGGIDQAVAWFPLVGALVALGVAGAYAALYPWLPSLLGAIVAVTVGVMLTGGIHEDGLADTLDGFGSGKSRDQALRIMRDPTLGTFGTAAVLVSLLWRVVAIGSLTPIGAAAGLVMAHTLGRTGAVVLMAATAPARSDGMGHSGASGARTLAVWAAVGSGSAFSLLAMGWWAVSALFIAGLVVLALRRVSLVKIGGVTGDVLGACEQIIEMTALGLVAAAAWQGWSPWWDS